MRYTEQYDRFAKGDKVTMARTADEGRAYPGTIVAVWQGEPFAWPFLVRYEAPLWPGEYCEAWAAPWELEVPA